MSMRPSSHQRGFTFIEIVMALAILASAITIFIGLQSAAIQRSIHDRNMQQAMLTARRILAAIEQDPTKLDQGSISPIAATELLSQLNAPTIQDPDEQQVLLPFMASVTVTELPIPAPNFPPDNQIRKVEVAVAWGTDPDQQFVAVYYVPMTV